MNRLPAALYLRLSREDDEKDGISQSIQNQRDFLLDYCGKNGIPVADLYIDDGYSGTNFNRPAFLRLLSDIEDKKIGLVLTKDLSRLGRDYILTGYYLERYFPEHHIRYIAVNDSIDTACDQGENDLTPFRAVFNDMYARDISKKVRAAFKAKREMGKFIGTFAPYGYRKDPNDKNHLLIDEAQAFFVRKIYALLLAGETISHIAKLLTAQGIPPPSAARNMTEPAGKAQWNYTMVRRILTMPTYKGDLVSHMSRKISYKVEKAERLPPEQWVITTGTHDGIVSGELFARVQALLAVKSYTERKTRGGTQKPFTGLLFCADCGARMILWSNGKSRYFVCSTWKKAPSLHRCTAHFIREDAVAKAVQYAVKKEIAKADRTEVLQKAKEKTDAEYIEYAAMRTRLERKVEEVQKSLSALFLDRANKTVDEREYSLLLTKLGEEQKELQQQLDAMRISYQGTDFIDRAAAVLFDGGISGRAILKKLIQKIEVGTDKNLTIYFYFPLPEKMDG